MNKKVEFVFDVGSPTAYLAYTQLPSIVAHAGSQIVWIPILLGGLFKIVGNQSPAHLAPKSAWMKTDLPRFAKRYGVAYKSNQYFPVNTLALMRGAVATIKDGNLQQYLAAIFPAMWAQSKNLGDAGVVRDVLKDAGMDADHLFERIKDPEVKDKLKSNTETVAQRGAFGAPTFFVGEEMFFGQDRLDFVIEALDS